MMMELGQKFNFDLAPLFVPDKRVCYISQNFPSGLGLLIAKDLSRL